MIKTIEELKQASDEELLKMYEEAQGDTASFKTNFGVDFSYSMLTQTIKDRGYVQAWVKKEKTKKVVEIKMSKDNASKNLNMTKECNATYSKFLEDKGYPFVHTTAALMLYMDAYKKKEIEVKVVL